MVAAVCVLAVGAILVSGRLTATTRLLRVVWRVASGPVGRIPSVREYRVTGRSRQSVLEAIVYRPAGRLPRSGVILVAGVSELGCQHPRLVSLSRALADVGFLVLTPDIKMLREFRIFPPPLDEISFWLREVRGLEGGQALNRVGLAGISFSGTLSLIAASQPRNLDLVSYVVGIGSFDDLVRCGDFWFGSGPVTVGNGYYPTRYYGRWVIMLAALDLLREPEDRRYLEIALNRMLLQIEVPKPPESLTDAGRRWHRLAVMREDQADPELARQIELHVAAFLQPALSTREAASEIRCPVFLAHGAHDDLIPPDESRRLQAKIAQARSYLLISPFLTHTHPWQNPMSLWHKAVAVVQMAGFFFHLTGVM